jgi:hypothetical protein
MQIVWNWFPCRCKTDECCSHTCQNIAFSALQRKFNNTGKSTRHIQCILSLLAFRSSICCKFCFVAFVSYSSAQNPHWQALVQYAKGTLSYTRVADGTGNSLYSSLNRRVRQSNENSKGNPSFAHFTRVPTPPIRGQIGQEFTSVTKLAKDQANIARRHS